MGVLGCDDSINRGYHFDFPGLGQNFEPRFSNGGIMEEAPKDGQNPPAIQRCSSGVKLAIPCFDKLGRWRLRKVHS